MRQFASIVPYQSKYQQAVIELVLAIQQKEFGIAVTLDDQPDLLDVQSVYGASGGGFWVALADGKVVGSIGLIRVDPTLGVIRKMFVSAPARGTGTAAALLKTVLRYAADSGVERLLLGTVPQYHAAHRFYAKHGFKEIGEATLPANFPRMPVDTKFYARELARRRTPT